MFASEHEATHRYFQLAESTGNKLATLSPKYQLFIEIMSVTTIILVLIWGWEYIKKVSPTNL